MKKTIRFDKFSSNKDFYKKELINYQKEIKYSKKPIQYAIRIY